MTTATTTRGYTAALTAVNRNQKNTGWAVVTAPRQGMQYPDTFYINDNDRNQELVEAVKALKGHEGQHICLTLSRGRLRDGKPTGSNNDWDYMSNIVAVELLDHAPAAASANGAAPAAGGPDAPPDPAREGYARGQAINGALALAAAAVAAGNPLPGWGTVRKWRDEIYWEIALPPIGSNTAAPAEAPSVPAQPPQGQEPSPIAATGQQRPAQPTKAPPASQASVKPGTLTPAAIKKRIIDGPLAQWNADIAAGAREGQMLTVKFLGEWAKAKHDLDLDNLTRDQSIIVANAIANGLVK